MRRIRPTMIPVMIAAMTVAAFCLALATGTLAQTPATVGFATFFGTGNTTITSTAVDPSGNVWIAGTTNTDLNATSPINCAQTACAGLPNIVFAAKFDPTGKLLVSLALGEGGTAAYIAVDASGNLYIAGNVEGPTSQPFPSTAGAYDTTFAAGKAFVAKIDPTGTQLLYSTYYGAGAFGNSQTHVASLAVDSAGDTIIGGFTNQTIAVTASAVQSTCQDCSSQVGGSAAFVAEFNPAGSALTYATYLSGTSGCLSGNCGGGPTDRIAQIIPYQGKIIISGAAYTSDFPTTASAYLRNASSCTVSDNQGDVTQFGQSFVAAIDPTQTGIPGLPFSTRFCSTINAVTVDSSGNLWLGVQDRTSMDPPTSGSFVPAASGYEGIAELDPTGSNLLKLANLGLDGYSDLTAIQVGADGGIWAAGDIWTDTTAAPELNETQPDLGTATQCNAAGWPQGQRCRGIWLVKLDPQLDALSFGTVFGPQQPGTNGDTSQPMIAVDTQGNAYIAGLNPLPGNPVTTGAYESAPPAGATVTDFLASFTNIPTPSGLSLTTDHLFFGQGNFSSPVKQQVGFVNHTGSSLTISSIVSAGELKADQACVGALADGASCTLNVTFLPTTAGDGSGSVTITDSASASPHVIGMTGEGVMGVGSPASTSLGFPATDVNKTATLPLLFNNTGNATLNVASIAMSGDFTETDNCSGGIPANNGCSITAMFKPSAGGNRTGTMTITDDGPASPHVIQLSGTGNGPAVTATLSPASLTFASQTTGATSAAQSITVTAGSAAALTISGVSISGPFAQTNTCGTGIAASATCIISVTFTPTASGAATGSLVVTDNAGDSPESVSLSGTGVVAAPAAALSPTSLTFASQLTSSTSAAQFVTLANSGTAALAITSIAASGDFAQTNTCGSSLPAGKSCAIAVTFTPAATGDRTGTLTVTDNASGSPQTAALTGTGADLTIAPGQGSSASSTVTAGQPATYTLSFTPVSGATGTFALTCTGAPTGATCTPSPASISLSGSSPATTTVTVTTTASSLVIPWWMLFTGCLGLLFWLLACAPAPAVKRRLRLATVVGFAAFAVACGGGSGGSTNTGGGNSNPTATPAGTYNLTVTATNGTATRSSVLTLVVQ